MGYRTREYLISLLHKPYDPEFRREPLSDEANDVAEPRYVWIAESMGGSIYGVASSPETAAEQLKALHPQPPYLIAWHAPIDHGEGVWTMAADFANVPGHSIAHRADFEITRYALDDFVS